MPDYNASGPAPTGVMLQLTADELQELAMLLGLISDEERQFVFHADAAITRIIAAAEASRGLCVTHAELMTASIYGHVTLRDGRQLLVRHGRRSSARVLIVHN